MSLKELQQHWDHFGEKDAMYAILTDPEKTGNRWSEDEFFATGKSEVGALMKSVEPLGYPLSRETALDFGCGAGRLSQALADWFEHVYGVDIAPSMVATANRYNRHPERCQYTVCGESTLPFESETFDFIYSYYVLQHMESRYQREYIAEFMRLLKPGGLAVFQFTSRPERPVKRMLVSTLPMPLVRGYRRLRFGRHYMEMHGLSPDGVAHTVRQHGGDPLSIETLPRTGSWQSHLCYATKR
jgi:SAM-dependent methyltransferase